MQETLTASLRKSSASVVSSNGNKLHGETQLVVMIIFRDICLLVLIAGTGNQDFVGNHVSSFFINDGAEFPDLIHAVKQEVNKGFPTDGTAHATAYDFFNLHPEGAFQLMMVLSDLGIPRDPTHMRGNSVHTYVCIRRLTHV